MPKTKFQDLTFTVIMVLIFVYVMTFYNAGMENGVTFSTFGYALKNMWVEGLIVIRYYLALRGAENGVTAMVTPFFCVQRWISQQQARKSQESLHHPRS